MKRLDTQNQSSVLDPGQLSQTNCFLVWKGKFLVVTVD